MPIISGTWETDNEITVLVDQHGGCECGDTVPRRLVDRALAIASEHGPGKVIHEGQLVVVTIRGSIYDA